MPILLGNDEVSKVSAVAEKLVVITKFQEILAEIKWHLTNCGGEKEFKVFDETITIEDLNFMGEKSQSILTQVINRLGEELRELENLEKNEETYVN